MIILRQTNYSEKKEESKAQKIAKSGAILGSGVAALGGAGEIAANIKGNKLIKEGGLMKTPAGKISDKGVEVIRKGAKLKKLGRKAGLVGLAGLGASIGSAEAYRQLKKDKK